MDFETWWRSLGNCHERQSISPKVIAKLAWNAAESLRPEWGEKINEALAVIFHNVDTNGDPVGAQPEGPWEKGYCAGIRFAYRTLKARGVPLPHQDRSGGTDGV